MKEPGYVIGADIGGTHCTAALIDMQQRSIVRSSITRTAIDAGAEAANIIAAWAHCMHAAKKDHEIAATCVAMPGPFDYEQGISLMQGQNKYEKLYALNIKELLATSLQTSPAHIFMDNDAACFLQGEVFGGSAQEHNNDTVIGITLGTGLGTAIYRHGKAASADLWSLPCKNGIAEDWISSRWLMQRYRNSGGLVARNVKELSQLAGTNVEVQLIFREFGASLGNFLLQFIARENPRAIVIGGNIAKAHPLFGCVAANIVREQYPAVSLKWSVLGEEAPLLGAAGSWWASHSQHHLPANPSTTI